MRLFRVCTSLVAACRSVVLILASTRSTCDEPSPIDALLPTLLARSSALHFRHCDFARSPSRSNHAPSLRQSSASRAYSLVHVLTLARFHLPLPAHRVATNLPHRSLPRPPSHDSLPHRRARRTLPRWSPRPDSRVHHRPSYRHRRRCARRRARKLSPPPHRVHLRVRQPGAFPLPLRSCMTEY